MSIYDERKIGHACIADAIAMAEENNVSCLALTHLQRDFRKNDLPKLREKITSQKTNIIIPEPFDEFTVQKRHWHASVFFAGVSIVPNSHLFPKQMMSHALRAW